MVLQSTIRAQLGNCFTEARFPEWEAFYTQGKVRDIYTPPGSGLRILISTDRQSALDHVLCAIPFKGQALNEVAHFWFEQTADIMPNHLVAVPHPNVMVVNELKIIPTEVVVRAYLTGSSGTAIWTHYRKGVRDFYGHITLPDGMPKNTPLPKVIVTPTTKHEKHDRNLHEAEIIGRDMVEPRLWKEAKRLALALFERGSEVAGQQGLILVDTKYEMGINPTTGYLTLADEIHTPDSSRFWINLTYQERYERGEEPEGLDKEFLRLWLEQNGYTADKLPDTVPDDVRIGVAERCIGLSEQVTGRSFIPQPTDANVLDEIRECIAPYFVPTSKAA